MKKLLVLIMLLWIIVLPCFAMYLDDSPERYSKVYSRINMASYVDNNSIAVTRYDPPFYVIQADVYNAWYEDETVSKEKCKLFYDYDTKEVIIKVSNYHFMFNFNGIFLASGPAKGGAQQILPGTNGMVLANYLFYKCYNMKFK
ncbi:hypothetical protein [Megasphaera sp.]|uniref:hypothetical protein n=1 Tax=Megasphaera sp. TaxID=2023260 RepID=UPI00307AA573